MSEIVTITVFDDGRGDFKKHINEWIITKKMFNGSTHKRMDNNKKNV